MLEFHPLANLFPLIEGEAFAELVADVKVHGIRERIRILDGKILDGRNRYRAGIAAGVINPEAPAHDGIGMQSWCLLFLPEEGDPLDWVLSKNLHRRHLDESQRAALGARLETLMHGGARRDQDATLQLNRADIGKLVNVSPRSIAKASKVKSEGAPELFGAIESGQVTANVAEKLLALPHERQVAALTGNDARRLPTLAKQAMREATEKRLADKTRALPTKLYNVVYADPAWRFEPYSRDTGLDRAADNHYPTQDLEAIKRQPVGSIAAPDCVLFLWATAPMLPEALCVMRFWGFDYKSQTIWRKAEKGGGLVLGTGYWFRNGHELLLVGTRGNIPAPAPGEQWPSMFDAPPRKHSEKPDHAYELIEAYYPNLPKIELNARRRRTGWDAWGLEAPDAEADYLAALAKLGDRRGHLTMDAAEELLRLGREANRTHRQLVDDLGHPPGTIKTWLNRLQLTDFAAMERANAAAAAEAQQRRGGAA